MAFRTQYPNTVDICGSITDVQDCGPTAGSGSKVRAWLRNPSEEKQSFDVNVQCLGFGKNADRMMEAGPNRTIHVTGRIGTDAGRTVVIADQVFFVDEAPLELS